MTRKARDRFQRGLAHQLGHPSGLPGRVVAWRLNRFNRPGVATAVRLAAPDPGSAAADIGFGGGVGLRMLLDEVGPTGVVHGVDISTTMLDRARRRYASEHASGRLVLHEAPVTALPLADQSLHAAVTVNTVYFVEDLAAALTELARVLHPGGRVVLGVGDPEAMAALPFTSHGFRIRPIADLIAAMAAAGLTLASHDRLDPDPRSPHFLVGVRPPAD